MTEQRTDKGLRAINIFLIIALATDIITPFLIWKGYLPSAVRWGSHAAIISMMGLAYARMLWYNRVPVVVWVVAALSLIGVTVAFLHGQRLLPTAWGWWVMFQFPLVGLYAYLQPRWPRRFPQLLLTICMSLLGIQLLIQVGQYLTGEPPGDNLAGFFGDYGTGDMLLFIALVLCMALGRWLAHGTWRVLALAFVLALVISAFGEVKFFMVVAAALGALAMVVYTLKTGQIWKLVPYSLVLLLVTGGFFWVYGEIVGNERIALQAYIEEPERINEYLGTATRYERDGRYYYDVGRNYALQYGWQTLSEDPLTLLFGYGLGARGESSALGTAGTALQQGGLGLSAGTSLLVLMQELGLVGLTILGGFMLWVVLSLMHDIKDFPEADGKELRYGLLLFTLLWIMWLWYNKAWTLRVPMLFYWIALGYVFNESHRLRKPHLQPAVAHLQDKEPTYEQQRSPGTGGTAPGMGVSRTTS
jgi:hypothetical protein